jgi:hypothetical protein
VLPAVDRDHVEYGKNPVGQGVAENITSDIEIKRPPQEYSQYHGIQKGCRMIGNEYGRITFLQFIQPNNINPPEENFKSQPHQGTPKPIKHLANYEKIKTPFITRPFHLHEFALELALICDFCNLNALNATQQTSDNLSCFFSFHRA